MMSELVYPYLKSWENHISFKRVNRDFYNASKQKSAVTFNKDTFDPELIEYCISGGNVSGINYC